MTGIGGSMLGTVCDISTQTMGRGAYTQAPNVPAGMNANIPDKDLPGLVGAYFGGSQWACGVLRPTGQCLMRESWDGDAANAPAEPSGVAFDRRPPESSPEQKERHLRRNPPVGLPRPCRTVRIWRPRRRKTGQRPFELLLRNSLRRRAAQRLQHLVDAQRHHDGAHRRDADAALLCAHALSLGGAAQGRERSGRASGASSIIGASRTSSTIWCWSTSPPWDSRSAFRLHSGRATRRR